MGISCADYHGYSSQDSQLAKTSDDFFPPAPEK